MEVGRRKKEVVRREQNALAEVESVGWLSQNIREEDNIHITISGERWKERVFCLGGICEDLREIPTG